jgi:polysaccharide pyruvyl transferase CsaB
MTALLMGYYGARNVGDELMLFCLRRWLSAQSIDITVLSEYPDDVSTRHQLPAVMNSLLLGPGILKASWLRPKTWRLVRALRNHDVLMVGGGDLIREDAGWRGFLFTVEKIVLALLLRKPVYLVNIGIGRPVTRLGACILRWCLRRCRRILVRDLRSMEVCRALGAGHLAQFVPDIVMSLPRWINAPSLDGPSSAPYYVVSLRSTANAFGMYRLDHDRLKTLAAGLDYLVESRGVRIVFLPFQCLADERDNDIHSRLAELMRHRDQATVHAWTAEPSTLAGLFRQARGVVAMRLHAAILALAYETPCVVLPYDHKVQEISAQFDLTPVVTASTLDDLRELILALDAALGQDPLNRLSRSPGHLCWEAVRLA